MLQKIVILGTGGTIAGLTHETGGYRAGQVDIDTLLQQWGIDSLGLGIESRQVAQIDSKDMDGDVWRALLTEIDSLLVRADVAGLVVTHGTDTLEETAFMLSAVLDTPKPVVLTGAMRPANVADSDGPSNLSDAVRLVASAAVQGVCVAFAGKVHAGAHVQKVNATTLDAFSSDPNSLMGLISPDGYQGQRRAPRPPGDWPSVKVVLEAQGWPRVECVISQALASDWLLQALLHAPPHAPEVKGVVLVATGAGTWHSAWDASLQACVLAGVQIWVSTRCALSRLPAKPLTQSVAGFCSVPFTPAQARVGLMLSLLDSRPEKRVL
jgi:L-asparaginase